MLDDVSYSFRFLENMWEVNFSAGLLQLDIPTLFVLRLSGATIGYLNKVAPGRTRDIIKLLLPQVVSWARQDQLGKSETVSHG